MGEESDARLSALRWAGPVVLQETGTEERQEQEKQKEGKEKEQQQQQQEEEEEEEEEKKQEQQRTVTNWAMPRWTSVVTRAACTVSSTRGQLSGPIMPAFPLEFPVSS